MKKETSIWAILQQKRHWQRKVKISGELVGELFSSLILAERHSEEFALKTFRLIKNSKKAVGKEESLEKTMRGYYGFLLKQREKKIREFLIKHKFQAKK